MDVKTINRLAEIMTQHGLTELSLEQDQVKLHLARASAPPSRGLAGAEAAAGSAGCPSGAPAAPAVVQAPAVAPAPAAEVISSPLVGTFYSAPSPEAMPYVSAGSKVKPGDVLCIVEAMKVMNEIKAERPCVIAKVLVKNGSPVEFGQALFEITE
ncbi:MAG: acetyl-CoA carboxylase biotin carboxyl carrier protein [Lentisphaeria bacterium]|nr:acetyl-CoA carboxylase biotin carboxyl carrier protein [Lentisphaeria bacterium]